MPVTMAQEDAVLAAVKRLGVAHEIIPIDPAFADTAAFCERYGYTLDRSANTIIVASKKAPIRYAACVVLASTRLDVNGVVRRTMGVPKASFASVDEMAALTGMQVGGVTPFALPEGVPLYIDAAVMERDWVVLGGGGRSVKIKIDTAVFPKLSALVVSGLAAAPPGASPRES